MIRFISLCAWIFVVVVQGTNYKTWMGDNAPSLSPKALGTICLLATHDSGTYNLTNTIINVDSYGPPLTTLYNSLDTIAIMTGTPLDYLVGLFADGVRAASKCTAKDIYSQLCDGNRGLDMRLSVYNGNIYLAHALQGPSLSDVLVQVLQFLQETTGELVYMTLGHPYGFNQTYIDLFASLLDPFIQDGFAITPDAYPGNLLTYTYGQLVNSNRSRVVIVIDDTINPNNNSYFSASTYSPPDGGSNKLCATYTDSDNITVVIINQTANYIYCGTIPAPTSVSMTLTPSTADTAGIIINTIVAGIINPFLKAIALHIFTTALGLGSVNNLQLSYTSIYDIYVQQDMFARRTSIVEGIHNITTNSSIFLLYNDYYESNTSIIDFGIHISIE
jgi:hypothetical protein